MNRPLSDRELLLGAITAVVAMAVVVLFV